MGVKGFEPRRAGSGVELDDEALFERHRERDLVALGEAGHGARDLVLVPIQVGGRLGRDLERLAHSVAADPCVGPGLHSKLVGVRHIAQSEPDDRFLMRPAFLAGVAQLEEFGLAYDILVYSRHLPVAAELAARLPRQRFVLDHLAKTNIRGREREGWERDLFTLAAQPNVWAKLSGLVTEADWTGWAPDDIHPYLDVAFESFGPERLMIGSDWPVCTVAGDYARTMAVVSDYLDTRPAHERDAVLGGNAVRFWNLQVSSHA